MLTELRRLTRSPLDCSVWLSCPFRRSLCELPLPLPLEDPGEEFEIMVFEDSLHFDPEADVGISVESSCELSVW